MANWPLCGAILICLSHCLLRISFTSYIFLAENSVWKIWKVVSGTHIREQKSMIIDIIIMNMWRHFDLLFSLSFTDIRYFFTDVFAEKSVWKFLKMSASKHQGDLSMNFLYYWKNLLPCSTINAMNSKSLSKILRYWKSTEKYFCLIMRNPPIRMTIKQYQF